MLVMALTYVPLLLAVNRGLRRALMARVMVLLLQQSCWERCQVVIMGLSTCCLSAKLKAYARSLLQPAAAAAG